VISLFVAWCAVSAIIGPLVGACIRYGMEEAT